MVEKFCPVCGKKSYSSSEYNTPWFCPGCGLDISGEPVAVATINDLMEGSVHE